MNRKSAFLLLFPVLFVATSFGLARAATAQKTYALGISGGAGIPIGEFNDTHSTGYNVTGFIAFGVPDLPFGVRFDGVYSTFSGRTGAGGTTPNPDLRVIGVLGNLIYSFPGTSAKPYLVTGGGIYNSKPDVAGAKSENDFGFSAGLGVTFGVRRLAAFIEARFHGISRDATVGGDIQFVPVTLGIIF